MSSVIWGAADFMGGTMTRRRHAVAVLAGSQPFGLVTACIATAALGTWGFSSAVARVGIVAGLLGLGGLVAQYAALATGRMGIVSPISSIGVIIPLGIGLIRGEQPSGAQLLGVIVAIIGVTLASGPELSGGAPLKPVLLAGACAVLFGFGIYFMSLGGQINPGMTVVMMRMTQVGILLVIALVVRKAGGLRGSDTPMLAAIGVTDAGANIMYTSAAALGLMTVVSVLGSLYPVVTAVLAWQVHKERLLPIQYVGVAVTVVGVALITAG